MSTLKFEWDSVKSEINKEKHGVTFEEAASVFYDDYARLITDPEHSTLHEDRFVLLGISKNLRILTVCHCCRGNDGTIRLISARKATKTETQWYQGR